MLENVVEKDDFSFVAFSILARLFISVWKAKVICTLVQLSPRKSFPRAQCCCFRLNKGIFGNKDFICKQSFYTKIKKDHSLRFFDYCPLMHWFVFFPGHSSASISPKMNFFSCFPLNCLNSLE